MNWANWYISYQFLLLSGLDNRKNDSVFFIDYISEESCRKYLLKYCGNISNIKRDLLCIYKLFFLSCKIIVYISVRSIIFQGNLIC